MPPANDREARKRDLFIAAQALDENERLAFVSARCAGDQALQRELDELLALDRDIREQRRPDGHGETQSLRSAPPDRVGPYRVLAEIGEGGMGVVYLAEQTSPIRRRVALKLIKPGMDTRAVVARFESERQALALMDHPNIARVFDGGTSEDGRPYFVMEHVSGSTLTEFCDRSRMSVRRRLALFIQIGQGVQHAHQKGIIHRDLKPSNVLVTEVDDRPVPKIIDFGLAKAMGADLTHETLFTTIGTRVGTVAYMSPEQAGVVPLDVDTRSDVYSLGVILYELLCGCWPCDPDVVKAAVRSGNLSPLFQVEAQRPSSRLRGEGVRAHRIAADRSTRRAALTREIKRDLDWVTLRAMDHNRTKRYATVAEFVVDVERFLRQEPVSAGPPSVLYRVRKFVVRRRALVASLATIALVLIVATTFSWDQYALAESEASRAKGVTRVLRRLLSAAETLPTTYAGGVFESVEALGDHGGAARLGYLAEREMRAVISEAPLGDVGGGTRFESEVRHGLSVASQADRTEDDVWMVVQLASILIDRRLPNTLVEAQALLEGVLSLDDRTLLSSDVRLQALLCAALAEFLAGNVTRGDELFAVAAEDLEWTEHDDREPALRRLRAFASRIAGYGNEFLRAIRAYDLLIEHQSRWLPAIPLGIEARTERAACMLAIGHWKEADRDLSQVIQEGTRLLGAEHAAVLKACLLNAELVWCLEGETPQETEDLHVRLENALLRVIDSRDHFPPDSVHRARAEGRLGQLYCRQRDWSRAAVHLDAALAWVRSHVGRMNETQLCLDRAACHLQLGHLDDAIQILEQAFRDVDPGQARARARIAFDLSQSYMLASRSHDTIAVLKEAEEAILLLAGPVPAYWVRHLKICRAICLISLGRAGEARDLLTGLMEELNRIPNGSRPANSVAECHWGLGVLCAYEDRREDAEAHFVEGLRVAQERYSASPGRHSVTLRLLLSGYGEFLVAAGRLDQAAQHLRRCHDLFVESRDTNLHPVVRGIVIQLADVYQALGEADDAARFRALRDAGARPPVIVRRGQD